MANNKNAYIQINRQTNMHTYIRADRQTDGQTENQANIRNKCAYISTIVQIYIYTIIQNYFHSLSRSHILITELLPFILAFSHTHLPIEPLHSFSRSHILTHRATSCILMPSQTNMQSYVDTYFYSYCNSSIHPYLPEDVG